jgi:large subunit ribosomal protein L19
VTDGVGIEKIFPIHSPLIADIEVLRSFKVRRANIGFIRELTGKASRLKEVKKAA